MATKAIGDTAILGTAEPATAANDVEVAFRADRIHDAVAIGLSQDFVFPFAGIKTPFPDIACHVI